MDRVRDFSIGIRLFLERVPCAQLNLPRSSGETFGSNAVHLVVEFLGCLIESSHTVKRLVS